MSLENRYSSSSVRKTPQNTPFEDTNHEESKIRYQVSTTFGLIGNRSIHWTQDFQIITFLNRTKNNRSCHLWQQADSQPIKTLKTRFQFTPQRNPATNLEFTSTLFPGPSLQGKRTSDPLVNRESRLRVKKRWVFDAAAGAIWPPSSNEAGFSKNVWESGAPSAPQKTYGDFDTIKQPAGAAGANAAGASKQGGFLRHAANSLDSNDSVKPADSSSTSTRSKVALPGTIGVPSTGARPATTGERLASPPKRKLLPKRPS